MPKTFDIYLVSVEWLSVNKIGKFIPSKCPLELTQFLGGAYVYDTTIYNKIDEDYCQIAIKSTELVLLNDAEILYQIPNSDYWIVKGEWKVSERGLKYHYCPSINTVGEINLAIGEYKAQIRVAPNIENFDFQSLKQDFDGELWDLITSNSSKVKTQTSAIHYGDKVFRFAESKSIVNFIRVFEEIIKNPKKELKAATLLTSLRKVKPIAATYRSLARFGDSVQLPSKTSVSNYDIYENRFLCLMLYKISQIVSYNSKYSIQQIVRLKSEKSNINAKIEQLGNEPTVDGEEILAEINTQKRFYKKWSEKWFHNKAIILSECDNTDCKVTMAVEIAFMSDSYDFWVKKDGEYCLMSFPVEMDSILEEQKNQRLRIKAFCYRNGSAGRFPKYKVQAIESIDLLQINYTSIISKQVSNYNRLKTNQWRLILTSTERNKLANERENQIKTLKKRNEKIDLQISNLNNFSTEIIQLQPKLLSLVNNKFTRSISYERLSRFQPSMTYVQNFKYRKALKNYKEILEAAGIDISIFGYYEEILQYGIREIPQVYELWCLVSIIQTLEKTYSLKANLSDLKKMMNSIQPNMKKLENYLSITFEGNLAERSVILHYQKKLNSKRPDFILQISCGSRSINIVLDAKFKNYNYKLSASEEMRLLTEKYKINSNHFVFSIHPCDDLQKDERKTKLTNLGGEHIFSLDGSVELPFHQFGYIMAKPLFKDNLKKLIGMSFEYLLESGHNAKKSDRSIDPGPDYDMICMSCGSGDITVEKKSRGNNRYFYTCTCSNPDCQHTVHIDYCWNCKTKLFKHGSYWDYHKTSVWSMFDIHCPCCGMTVADMPKQEQI